MIWHYGPKWATKNQENLAERHLPSPFSEALAKTRRVLPTTLLEGFYVAKILKHKSTTDGAS